MPPLTYPDIKGNNVSIVDGERPFVLCFWDTFCGWCIYEIEILNEIASEFPNIRIIAIADQEHSVIKEFMENKNFLWDNITVISGYQNEYLPIIQSKSHPTTVLVSKSGVIEKIFYGGKIRPLIIGMDELDKSGE